MLKTAIPGLDQKLLHDLTLAELARLGLEPDHAPRSRPDPAPEAPVDQPCGPAVLADLLALHGEEFVRRAWLALAGTAPAASEQQRQMQAMVDGSLGKEEILQEIRRSPEGRRAGVAVPGLWWRLLPFKAARLPLLGGLLRFGAALYRLPETVLRANVLWSASTVPASSAKAPGAMDSTEARRLQEALEAAKARIRALEQTERPGGLHPPGMDELYLAFENAFRGSREQIKQRLAVYLPHLDRARAGAPDAPVLDIGCGRGEWLELLRDEGLRASGIDLNQISVDLCQSLGLEVQAADALSHLQDLPGNSLGAVTAFHLIEHLPLESLVALLDGIHQALMPGGVVILETPNPENLLVGACSFYRDPTHLRPIHPETALFLLTQRGFKEVRYSGLNPFTSPDMDQVPAGFLRRLFFAPQDYMIIGFK